jgi:hypothetical protein
MSLCSSSHKAIYSGESSQAPVSAGEYTIIQALRLTGDEQPPVMEPDISEATMLLALKNRFLRCHEHV